MKTLKLLLTTTLIFSVGLLLSRCSDDDVITPINYTVTGKITCPDFNSVQTAAGGAVIYLVKNTTIPATNYDLVTIANDLGEYRFDELEPGDYFMFANYNTKNTNLPNGRIIGINFGSGDGYLFTITAENVSQDISLSEMVGSGSDVINTTYGNWQFLSELETGDWGYDYNHSTIEFSFPFDNGNAPFSGDFGVYEIDIEFDQANPASTKIKAAIDLTSIYTGQPGRDALGKCIGRTLGVELDPADTTALGDPNPSAVIGTTGMSTFTSTSCIAYGDGYLAKGDMVLNGVTKEVDLFFKYIPGFQSTNSAGVTTHFSSFEGTFDFTALDDFNIESSHILDADVNVNISIQLRKVME